MTSVLTACLYPSFRRTQHFFSIMVRTRADCSGIRVGSKAAFKTTPKASSPSTSGKKRYGGSGNRYHPRETPAWQKEITHFLNPGVSGSAPKVEQPVGEQMAEPVSDGPANSHTQEDM